MSAIRCVAGLRALPEWRVCTAVLFSAIETEIENGALMGALLDALIERLFPILSHILTHRSELHASPLHCTACSLWACAYAAAPTSFVCVRARLFAALKCTLIVAEPCLSACGRATLCHTCRFGSDERPGADACAADVAHPSLSRNSS